MDCPSVILPIALMGLLLLLKGMVFSLSLGKRDACLIITLANFSYREGWFKKGTIKRTHSHEQMHVRVSVTGSPAHARWLVVVILTTPYEVFLRLSQMKAPRIFNE